MPTPVKLTSDEPYKIVSIATSSKSYVGVNPTKPAWQQLHIHADVHLWDFKPVGGGVFRLSLKGSYPYTGVGQENRVVATSDGGKDKEWVANYWDEFEAFTIEEKTDIFPIHTWTLSAKGPDAKVVLQPYEIIPSDFQLFKIDTSL